MQHGSDLLQQGAIETLCNAIVLRSVMNSKLLLHTCCLQMHNEFFSKVFTATIGVQHFDNSIVLGTTPGFKVPVDSKGFALLAEKMQVHEASFVICEGDIVTSPSNCFDRSWSPDIHMHLSTELCGTLTNTFLGDGLPSSFCIDTGLTKGRFIFRQIKLQA